MAEMEIGQPQSSGIGGIPTKYVVIGAGVLGVAAILLMQRGGGGGAATGDAQPTGSVSAQLSSVQQMQLEQFGELTKQLQSQGQQFSDSVAGLGTHLDTNAAALTSTINAGFTGLSGQVNQANTEGQQIFAQQGQQYQGLMAALWQIFNRGTNSAWMPGDSRNPYVPENTTQAA